MNEEDTTCRVPGKTFDEVEELVMGLDLPFDVLIHGRRDETEIFVTGPSAFLVEFDRLGIAYEKRT